MILCRSSLLFWSHDLTQTVLHGAFKGFHEQTKEKILIFLERLDVLSGCWASFLAQKVFKLCLIVYNLCVVSLRGKVNIKWMQELLG